MARLGRVIVEALVLEWGRAEVLRRLAHPFWFQSLGAVMGMDWHSSGITTSVLGALKRGLAPIQDELGLWVCGGRGRHSRKTPDELLAVGDATGLDGAALARASRLTAKLDNAAVQDGFQIYLHSFIVTADGDWSVVQQGMAPERGEARRYHWLSEGLDSFVDDPHAAISGPGRGTIINLTDARARAARRAQVDLVRQGPARAGEEIRRVLPHLQLPHHHDVRRGDVLLRRLHGNLAAAAERGPVDFIDLLLTPGVGPRTVQALSLVAEVIYGAPARFSDPARFSFAHGGKDGHPFPVPLLVYDRTIATLKAAVSQARLGQSDRLAALRQLDAQARLLERGASGRDWEALVARERARSHLYGGRTVRGPVRPPAHPKAGSKRPRASSSRPNAQPAPSSPIQLDLFAPTRRPHEREAGGEYPTPTQLFERQPGAEAPSAGRLRLRDVIQPSLVADPSDLGRSRDALNLRIDTANPAG